MTLRTAILIIFAITLVGWLSWRLNSSRHSIPCPSWLSWLIELDNPFAKAHKAQAIVDSFSFIEGMQVLDIGCGPGRVTLPFAQKIAPMHGHVTGLDIQMEMLEKTKTKAQNLGITNVDFIHGTVDATEIGQRRYDAILMVCVLGEIPEVNRLPVVTKIAAALKPNGIISITETIFDPHFQRRQQVIELMRRAGFIQKKYIGRWFAYTMHFEKEVK